MKPYRIIHKARPSSCLKVNYGGHSKELLSLENLAVLLSNHVPAAGYIQFCRKLAERTGLVAEALIEDVFTEILHDYGSGQPDEVWLRPDVRLVNMGWRMPNYAKEFAHLMWVGITAATFDALWNEVEKRLHQAQENGGKIWQDGANHYVITVISKAAISLSEELSEGK